MILDVNVLNFFVVLLLIRVPASSSTLLSTDCYNKPTFQRTYWNIFHWEQNVTEYSKYSYEAWLVQCFARFSTTHPYNWTDNSYDKVGTEYTIQWNKNTESDPNFQLCFVIVAYQILIWKLRIYFISLISEHIWRPPAEDLGQYR